MLKNLHIDSARGVAIEVVAPNTAATPFCELSAAQTKQTLLF